MPNSCSNPKVLIWRFDTCKKKSENFCRRVYTYIYSLNSIAQSPLWAIILLTLHHCRNLFTLGFCDIIRVFQQGKWFQIEWGYTRFVAYLYFIKRFMLYCSLLKSIGKLPCGMWWFLKNQLAAKKKWPAFTRWHFQMHFLEWKYLNSD